VKNADVSSRILQLNEHLTEAKKNKYEILHDSFTSAVQEAKDYVEKNGYKVDEDDWHNNITTGQGRPKDGKTFKTTILLTKGGKEQRKAFHIQVYNRGEGNHMYELNCYIS